MNDFCQFIALIGLIGLWSSSYNTVKQEASIVVESVKLSQVQKPYIKPITYDTLPENLIVLNNPSFEDYPHLGNFGRTIANWFDCGQLFFSAESPPDIHPVPNSEFKVDKQAYHGKTYVGLVLRDNGTWESISQKLSSTIKKDSCYSLSIATAIDKKYQSPTKRNQYEIKKIIDPIKFQLWAGNGFCDKKQLLAESELITHSDWKVLDFQFKSNDDYKYFFIQAFYYDPRPKKLVNGHILLDYMTPIIPIACE